MRRGLARLKPHHQQTGDDGKITHGIDQKTNRHAGFGHQHAGHGRADDARAVDDGTVQRNCVHQILAARDFDEERLARGHVERHRHAAQRGDDDEVDWLNGIFPRQPGQHKRQQHHARLCDQHDVPLGMTVGQRPAQNRKKQHRRRSGGGHRAEQQFGTRQLINQPAQGRVLHPGAGERNHLPDEKEPEIAMP